MGSSIMNSTIGNGCSIGQKCDIFNNPNVENHSCFFMIENSLKMEIRKHLVEENKIKQQKLIEILRKILLTHKLLK